MPRQFSRVAVVGVGWMGAQIARVFAEAGLIVHLVDTDPTAIARGKERIHQALRSRAAASIVEDVMSRLVESRLDELSGVEFVQEAIPEDMGKKQALFAELDGQLPPNTTLGSNTSSMSLSELAARCQVKHRVVGVHWVSPAYVIPIVEVIHHPQTAPEVVRDACDLLKQVGKRPIVCREIPGFLINRLQHVLLNEAFYLLHSGYATKEDIDAAVRFAIAPRWALWGPLRTHDLVVNKRTMLHSAGYIYGKTGDPRFRPAKVLEELVARDRLGFESGAGFYSYAGMDPKAVTEHRDAAIEDILRYLEDHNDDAFWGDPGAG